MAEQRGGQEEKHGGGVPFVKKQKKGTCLSPLGRKQKKKEGMACDERKKGKDEETGLFVFPTLFCGRKEGKKRGTDYALSKRKKGGKVCSTISRPKHNEEKKERDRKTPCFSLRSKRRGNCVLGGETRGGRVTGESEFWLFNLEREKKKKKKTPPDRAKGKRSALYFLSCLGWTRRRKETQGGTSTLFKKGKKLARPNHLAQKKKKELVGGGERKGKGGVVFRTKVLKGGRSNGLSSANTPSCGGQRRKKGRKKGTFSLNQTLEKKKKANVADILA